MGHPKTESTTKKSHIELKLNSADTSQYIFPIPNIYIHIYQIFIGIIHS